MKMTAIITGATGLVGRYLVKELINHPDFDLIRIFTRHSVQINHHKVEEHLVDFEHIENWKHLLRGDVLFSSLGTTRAKAGGKTNQFKVDYHHNYDIAFYAAQNGVARYVLVSSAGANPNAVFFYSRMKGRLEEAVMKLSFERIAILRPSILDGPREESRKAEKLALQAGKLLKVFPALKKYSPIHGRIVAKGMIQAIQNLKPGEKKIIKSSQIHAFVKTDDHH